jgi:hypothetical protein
LLFSLASSGIDPASDALNSNPMAADDTSDFMEPPSQAWPRIPHIPARMLPPAHQPPTLFFSRAYNPQRLAGIDCE